MTTRPTIRVGIGMTVDELKSGSTYRFKDEPPSFQPMPGQKAQYPADPNLHAWTITEPYNLVYVYKEHELKKDDIGGDNYLIAITTAPMSQKVVNYIQVTFQNRALTLDEALAEAKKLNDWFIQAGFHLPVPGVPTEGKKFDGPFAVDEQERHAPRYDNKITTYSGARGAFLDPRSQIVSIAAFGLDADDAQAGLVITNARRKREDVGGDRDESNDATEREYFLNLYISARPTDKYDNK